MPNQPSSPNNDSSVYELVRDFVGKQNQLEAERRQLEAAKAAQSAELESKLTQGNNAILRALDTWGRELRAEFKRDLRIVQTRLDDLATEVDDVKQAASETRVGLRHITQRVDGLETDSRKIERRNQYLASMPVERSAPWELGVESDTGTHRVIPALELEASRLEWERKLDEKLEARELAKSGNKWNTSVRWVLGTVGAVTTALLIAILVALITVKQPLPAQTGREPSTNSAEPMRPKGN